MRGTLRLELVHGDQRQAAKRVVLEGPHRQVEGRSTDVMGVAAFELEPGTWHITTPELTKPASVQADGGDQWVTVELPLDDPEVLRGRVVAGGIGKAGVVVTADVRNACAGAERAGTGVSDTDGLFDLDLRERGRPRDGLPRNPCDVRPQGGVSVTLQARVGDLVAAQKTVPLSAKGVTLELVKARRLRILIGGRPPASARVVARAPGESELLLPTLDGETFLFVVPPGLYRVMAVTERGGVLLRDDEEIVVKEDEDQTFLMRPKPTPPISGVLTDERHLPLAGVSVGLYGLSSVTTLKVAAKPDEIAADALATTDGAGRFSLRPTALSGPLPLFRVALPRGGTFGRLVLVQPGDAPLELTVVGSPRP